MITDAVVRAARELAYSETDRFGLPTRLHLDLSLEKAEEIAIALGADVQVAIIGTCMMDVKLGEAFKTGKQPQHVKMSADKAREFLVAQGVSGPVLEKIVNCVEAHHKAVPFESREAEIVANADCYRFVHPKGVFHYIGTLTKRDMEFKAIIDGAEAKLEEKKNILSLPYCISELEPFYRMFKDAFAAARTTTGSLVSK